MKVSGSQEHSPVSLQKSAIHKIAITPNSRKAFQDCTAVVYCRQVQRKYR